MRICLYTDTAFPKLGGQEMVVENKTGAGGNIGTDAVAKAEPDGATIGISLGGPLAINTLLFSKLPYNPTKDITPITLLTSLPSVLVVPTSLGMKPPAKPCQVTRQTKTVVGVWAARIGKCQRHDLAL